MKLRLRVTLKDLNIRIENVASLLLNYTAEVKSGISHMEEKLKAKRSELMSRCKLRLSNQRG